MAKTTKTAKTKAKASKAAKPQKRAPVAKAPKARKATKVAVKVPPVKTKAAKPVSLADALAPLAGPAGKAAWQPVLTQTETPRRYLADIKVGDRARKDMGDIAALAASIDARGALLEPIVIAPDGTLIDGERRMLAWAKSKVGGYGKEPIPVSIVDIDSIIAGEYDANEQREAFKPTELVAIKRAIEAKLAAAAHERKGHGLTAPGRKMTGEVEGKGRTSDRVGAAAGVSGRTVQKAEKVVEAAERDPERFGKLVDDMNRTGKVDGAFKRLQIMEATDRLREAPPPLPGNGPYVAGSIDYPWPHESDDDQASIDERGRSLRPYPAMSIEAGEVFMREKVAPLFGPNAALGFWTTNHHLVNGAAHRLIAALGPDWRASTMLTWAKDKIGRGQVLRDKTEHCIVLMRGKPVVNVLGEDPPSTLLFGPRRDNSQKPEDFYLLWERTFPAPRYASIFSTGGEGEAWDGHGDQVDKHAPDPKKGITVAEFEELKALHAVESGATIEGTILEYLLGRDLITTVWPGSFSEDGPIAGGFVLSDDGKSRMRDLDACLNPAAPASASAPRTDLDRLAMVGMGEAARLTIDEREDLRERKFIKGAGDRATLTKAGSRRLETLRVEAVHAAALAELPDDLDGLTVAYRDVCSRLDAAVRAGDEEAAKEIAERRELYHDKAGTLIGPDEAPVDGIERLMIAAAAPIGNVPCWGQRGMFQ
ncbi:hypothetical protein RA307_30875, partial [Xanthobacteraceae bacterium Astr-EGSB]|uniref:ParB N-terminal domain-containing protein n=1 Tax=Astrobacterium formosum TaxID=3069710 RepID=UPI0027B68385|nr:hypothetical protein [Xanthobacteraceae bacterium Astr-EGSB]